MGIRRSQIGRGDIARDANWLRPFLPAIGGDTYRVRVSADDTAPDYLEAKITSADSSVAVTVANDGADEDLDLSVAVYVAAEIADHTADADAHHNWPLLDGDIPSSIARDSEVTSAISAHAADANAHHNRSHGITSGSDHTVTGAALDVVGLTATNTIGILTPSAAVLSATSALLKTDSNGYVAVQRVGVGTSPSVPLHFYKATDEFIRIGTINASENPFISFYIATVRHAYLQANSDNNVYLAAQYGSIVLATGAAGTATNRVTIDSAGDVDFTGSITIGTNGNQNDRFLMTNSNVSGGSVFYDFNQTDRDAGSTGAFEMGFYRDANNITEVRMSKEVFEVIIRSGGTYRFPLEVRAQQVILAELPTSNPGIVGALYRSGGTVLVST